MFWLSASINRLAQLARCARRLQGHDLDECPSILNGEYGCRLLLASRRTATIGGARRV